MSFDCEGIKPKNSVGEHFNTSAWRWRPMWIYICGVCKLPENIVEGGHYNDGVEIDDQLADKIASRLSSLLANGTIKGFAAAQKQVMGELPDVECKHCKGTGIRDDAWLQGTCNVCKGRGVCRPSPTWYPFYEDIVTEFTEFCTNSGGFRIW